MKKIHLISSLLCSALVFGCGDDKDPMGSNTNPGTNSNTNNTNDGTDGNSSTGTPEPTTSGTTGNASNTAPDDTTAGGGSSESGSFLVDPDGGGGTKECSPWVQDCPEGQKCMPYSGDGDNSWESLKCVDVMENPGTLGDPCTVEGSGTTGIDSCDKGHMCWNTDENGQGTCVAQCTGSEDNPKCGPNTNCVIANDGVLTLCLAGCDPLLQQCENGDVCIPNPMGEGFVCVIDASGEEGQEWDPCEYANACDPGFLCANSMLANECDPGSSGCCLPFCDLTAAMCKGMNQECLPWYEEGQAPPGEENIGVCGIPQG